MYDSFRQEQARLETVELYRSVLLRTKNGKAMLTHMLGELGLFESTNGKTERELGRFDYAIRMLEIMGIPSYPNIHQFVNAAAKWPTEYPKTEEKT